MKESPRSSSENYRLTKQDSPSRTIFKKRSLWLLTFATVGYFCSSTALITWAPTYFINFFEVSAVHAGLLLSLFSGLGVLGSPIGAILSEHVIRKRAPVILLGYMVMSFSCLMMPLAASGGIVSAVGLLMLTGVFGCLGSGLGAALISEWVPLELSGTASGFLNLATLGGGISPYVFGVILDFSGSFNSAWLTIGFTSVILSSLMLPLAMNRLT
jgi:sugar phosphate permease